MRNKKTVSKAIKNRILAINEMIPEVLNADEIPTSYEGGTWPSYIDIQKPIEIKNQFVYIKSAKNRNSMTFEKRYNVNDFWQLDELKFKLTTIKRAFNKVTKNK